MNYFGVAVSILQIGAAISELKQGKWNLAAMWFCVAGANFFVSWR